MSKVYAQTDGTGCITAINSDIFLKDATNWTQIDEGEGDRYDHAQGCYLESGLCDDSGQANYKLADGAAYPRTPEEKASSLSGFPETDEGK